MSRRPGIGKRWFEKYKSDVYPHDFVVHDGTKFKSPRYYDRLYDIEAPMELNLIKSKRKLASVKYCDNNTPERLRVREVVLKKKVVNLQRGFENEERNVQCV